MFLTDAQVEQMSGCRQGKQRPSTLRRWLEEQGFVERVDFFPRVDGWYSVIAPTARNVEEYRPKVRA